MDFVDPHPCPQASMASSLPPQLSPQQALASFLLRILYIKKHKECLAMFFFLGYILGWISYQGTNVFDYEECVSKTSFQYSVWSIVSSLNIW